MCVNGETAILVSGLMLRSHEESIIKGMHFETFFGGKCLLALVTGADLMLRFTFYDSGHTQDISAVIGYLSLLLHTSFSRRFARSCIIT